MSLHQAEAGEFMTQLAADVMKGARQPVDLLFVDLFNGKDDIPSILCSSGAHRPQILALCTEAFNCTLAACLLAHQYCPSIV